MTARLRFRELLGCSPRGLSGLSVAHDGVEGIAMPLLLLPCRTDTGGVTNPSRFMYGWVAQGTAIKFRRGESAKYLEMGQQGGVL